MINKVYVLYLQLAEFFMFAGLMFVTVIIFTIMATFYTYVDYNVDDDDDDDDDDDEKTEKLDYDNPTYDMVGEKEAKLSENHPQLYEEIDVTAL